MFGRHDSHARLQHSFAYLIRRRDAEVTFRLAPLLRELLYNMFGQLLLPIILCVHGRVGAYNRLYLGCGQRTYFPQLINIALFVVVNVLYAVYYGSDGFGLSIFELLSVNLLNLLRCATIGVKYATFTRAELRELDARMMTEEERNEKLVIVGWAAPPPHVLFMEMERAITRMCPHLGKHRIVFPDAASRDAVLHQMAVCLPSYNEFELGVRIPSVATTPSPPTVASSDSSASATTVKQGDIHDVGAAGALPRTGVVSPASSASGDPCAPSAPALSPSAPTPPLSNDSAVTLFLSIMASQHALTTKELNFDAPNAGEQQAPTAPASSFRRSSQPQVRLGMKRRSSIASAGSFAATDPHGARMHGDMSVSETVQAVGGAITMQVYVKAHIPSAVLPCLPAKLFLWHVTHTAYMHRDLTFFFVPAFVVTIAFTALPFVIRSALRAWGEVNAVALACLVLMAEQNFFLLFTTLSFLVVGVLDHTRRLDASKLLHRMLDHNALIALQMHDATEPEEPEADDSNGVIPMLRPPPPTRAMEQGSETLADVPRGRFVVKPMLSTLDEDEYPASSPHLHHAAVQPNQQLHTSVSSVVPGLSLEREGLSSRAGVARDSIADVSRVSPSLDSDESDLDARSARRMSQMDAEGRAPDGERVNATAPRPLRARRTASSLHAARARYRQDFAHMDLHPEEEDALYDPVLRRMMRKSGSQESTTPPAAPELAPQPSLSRLQRIMSWVPQQARVSRVASSRAVAPIDALDVLADGRGRAYADVEAVMPLSARNHLPAALSAGHVAPQRTPASDVTQQRVGGSHLSRRMRAAVIARQLLLSPNELHEDIVVPSAALVSVPLMYPQNILAWSHLRSVTLDLGRSYNTRVQAFTSFFAVFCVVAVVFLFFMLAEKRVARSSETYVVLALAGFEQLAFGSLLTLQVVQGARVNREGMAQQRRLNIVQSLTYEFLVTTSTALPAIIRDRVQQARKVAQSVVEALNIDMAFRPARVMFLPAHVGLLSTMASVTISGILAMYQGLRTSGQ